MVPLRERKEDIISIIEDKKELLNGKILTQEAIDELIKYNWTGNVRELLNVLKVLFVENENSKILKEDIVRVLKENSLENFSKYFRDKDKELEKIWDNIERGKTFWELVKNPFKKRELNRKQVRTIINKAYEKGNGNYKTCLKYLNIKESDYKKFLNFLTVYKI